MTWYVSTALDAPAGDWIKVGRTYVELYVLHKKPILSQDPNALVPTLALHTTIHLGCKNAKGLTSPESIVDKMYKEFRNQKVYTYDGAGPMNYWGPTEAPGNFCFTTIGLLNYLGSRCQAWASFFNDMVRIQGIAGSEIAVVEWNYLLSGSNVNLLEARRDAFFGTESANVDIVTAVDPVGTSGFYAGFLVRKWTGLIQNEFVISEWWDQNNEASVLLDNGNVVYCKEVNGIASQGIDNPRSEFENHAIVKYDGHYYDPSYGTPKKSSANLYETAALAAFTGRITYTKMVGSQEKTYIFEWIAELNDPSVLQVNITP